MTPPRLDAAVVARRLRMLSDALGELGQLRGVTTERLSEEPLTRAAAERLLQVAVDLAVDVNSHLVAALTGAAPSTGRSSFVEAAGIGVVPVQLGERLAPAAGLRNILVHRYTDIRVDLVAAAVQEVLDTFPEYLREVARFLETGRDEATDTTA